MWTWKSEADSLDPWLSRTQNGRLQKNLKGKPEQEGTCEVEKGRISVLVEPQQTGMYTLEITYEIPPETRKVRVILDVR